MRNTFNFIFITLSIIIFTACNNKRLAENDILVKWCTFNIRYDNPADSLNNWKFRKDSVADFIAKNNFDVIGMQEVLDNQLNDLKKKLPQYSHVGVGREDGKTGGEYAPIFYLHDKYELLDSNTFWLSQYPDSAGFIGWDGACTRIATWAKLKDIKSGKIFMAVNTHFDHVGTEARKKSALLIIDKIKEIVGNKPAILTGDFNVTDSSEAYKTITNNNFVIKDAYKICDKKEGTTYTFHDFGRIALEKRQKIDFIFVTPSIKVLETKIAENKNNFFLSDHNPHIATLEF